MKTLIFRKVSEFRSVDIAADGATRPALCDGQALFFIDDNQAAQVGIWRRRKVGGFIDTPVNSENIGEVAKARLTQLRASAEMSQGPAYFTCPSDVARLVVWPEDAFSSEAE
jgi:hypothetical protein